MLDQEAKLVSTLNDRELEILRLLSAGHTAKSIAAATGLTVNAVNDRLRDARRKCGAASSRELARLIAAQENWAEKIELSRCAGEEHEPRDVRSPMGKPNSRKGKIMALSLGASAMFVAAWIGWQGVTQPTNRVARDAAVRLSEADDRNDPRKLAAALDSESRDLAWASQTELLLKRAYGPVLFSHGLIAEPSVRCARTLCEVLGVYPTAPSPEEELALRRALMPAAFPTLSNAGLAARGSAISIKSGSAPRLTILVYWQAPARL